MVYHEETRGGGPAAKSRAHGYPKADPKTGTRSPYPAAIARGGRVDLCRKLILVCQKLILVNFGGGWRRAMAGVRATPAGGR